MANPLFNALGGSVAQQGSPMNMIQQFHQFRQNFKGNPREEVEKLLNSGRMNQQQLNQLQGMAQQFMQMMGK